MFCTAFSFSGADGERPRSLGNPEISVQHLTTAAVGQAREVPGFRPILPRWSTSAVRGVWDTQRPESKCKNPKTEEIGPKFGDIDELLTISPVDCAVSGQSVNVSPAVLKC